MLKYKYIWGIKIKREGVYFLWEKETGHCLISECDFEYN